MQKQRKKLYDWQRYFTELEPQWETIILLLLLVFDVMWEKIVAMTLVMPLLFYLHVKLNFTLQFCSDKLHFLHTGESF